MARYEVIFKDGRKTEVNATDRDTVEQQAEHWDRDRFVIAAKRGHVTDETPSPSTAAVVTKVKD